ncbi:MAG TPA: hypothetical protein VGH80_06295 [Xanthomonadaceae bacterium]|jgi:hypothetical protein
MNRLKLLAVASLSALALSACTGDKNQAAKDPVTAAQDLSAALRANDFNRLTHIMVPPEDYAKLEQRYKDEAAKKPAPSAEESKQFADQMANLTGPDAETKIFADIQPKLAQMGPQIPMGVAMMSGMAGQSIDNNPKLSPDEKTQAKALLTAVTKWASSAPLADPDKAKQAIHVVVTTARDLKLTTLEASQKLTFAETVDKVGIAFGGLRKTMAVYGFDTDKAFDSVKVVKKSEDGDKAVVTISYSLLDTPVTGDVAMIKRDGHWYSADLVKSIEDSLANKPAEAAPAMAAPMAPAAPDANAMPQDANAPGADSAANDQAAPAPAEAPASPASDAASPGTN